jgi:hypothetical protein
MRCAGQGRAPRGLQPSLTYEFRNQHKVVAAAHKGGAEGVPDELTGEILSVDAGVLR